MSATCKYCGKMVVEGAHICRYCGKPVVEGWKGGDAPKPGASLGESGGNRAGDGGSRWGGTSMGQGAGHGHSLGQGPTLGQGPSLGDGRFPGRGQGQGGVQATASARKPALVAAIAMLIAGAAVAFVLSSEGSRVPEVQPVQVAPSVSPPVQPPAAPPTQPSLPPQAQPPVAPQTNPSGARAVQPSVLPDSRPANAAADSADNSADEVNPANLAKPLIATAPEEADPAPADSPDGLRGGGVSKVVRKHMKALRYCFEKEIQQSPFDARILVAFDILPAGQTSAVRVRDSVPGHPEFDACILGVFEKMRFPAYKGDSVVHIGSYPLTFKGK